MLDKVKIQDVKTGAIKEVKKSIAGDFIGTGKFILYTEKEKTEKPKTFISNVENN